MALRSDEDTIREFLTESFLFEYDDSLRPESNLFQLGLIDSFGFVELVKFLETEFAIQLEDEDLLGGALTSLSGMVETVRRKRAG